jgi:hypothetical protein
MFFPSLNYLLSRRSELIYHIVLKYECTEYPNICKLYTLHIAILHNKERNCDISAQILTKFNLLTPQ